MEKACGIDYVQAQSSIEVYEVEGIEIPVASKELLMRMKDTVRPSDKLDVEFLKSAMKHDSEK